MRFDKIRAKALDEMASSVFMRYNGRAFRNWAEFRKWDHMRYRNQLVEIAVDVTLKEVKKAMESKTS